MTLTIQEAENILKKVFANEVGTIRIEGGQPYQAGEVSISRSSFNRAVQLLATNQHKIEAIKLYREGTPNCGLPEAKEHVERIMT